MGRILPILLVFFLIVPWLSPLANAGGACTEQCLLEDGNHECKHGEMCPMKMKKKAEASQEEHSAGHICSVENNIAETKKQQTKAKEHCGTFIKCDKNDDTAGIPAPVVEADYLTAIFAFNAAEAADRLIPITAFNYTDPPTLPFDRPPANS